ncbi:tRNA-dihydrouridine synthase [Halorientalis sp.]|uniref:tRNA-dihydrouridine synthase n=1 Tax=Halorientalis sp. TaxID=1931229 RepID=UPI00261F5BB4|nr:tRNA-dihydrouridine synthase [Halorientalis sp.]
MSRDAAPELLDFRPQVALASLSGEADAEWARASSEYAGAAVLGGVALDEATREAARELVARDRSEFLPADPVAFVDEQLAALSDTPLQAGFNVRTTELPPLGSVAAVCHDRDAFVEINAHCRQEEMCAAGVGETLLRSPDRLRAQVDTAAETGATVSVKVRAEVDGVDLPALAERIEAAGADAVHVDAMDTESVVGDVSAATDLFVIANNEVRDRASVREYLNYGADAVSVGRPSNEPAVLERVSDATTAWFAEGVES